MKIHDKFVIELAEVIKGYGNDYRLEGPFHLPCDYKFYEISGVAICEESFNKMKRLEDEINVVLDKIRAEIVRALSVEMFDVNGRRLSDVGIGLAIALSIIDKYKAESEDKE